jgi:hypothetical protein
MIEALLWAVLFFLNMWTVHCILRRQEKLEAGLVIARDMAKKQVEILDAMDRRLAEYLENR